MDVFLNGNRYQLSFSKKSALSQSSTGLLNRNIYFNNEDGVFDEARGYLYYDPTSSAWVFCGLNQITPRNPRIMALILESPHKSEYDATGKPLRPANGKTGTCINNYLGKQIKATPPRNINPESIYKVHLVNAIQFQTSCYNQLHGFQERHPDKYDLILKSMVERVKSLKKVIFVGDFESNTFEKDGYVILEVTDITDPLHIFVEDKSRGSDYGD